MGDTDIGSPKSSVIIVRVSDERHRHLRPPTVEQSRISLSLHSLEVLLVLANVFIDLLSVIMVIRQRGVYVCQTELWEICHNFIRRLTFFRP